jgi:hypothetical protein
MATVLPVVIIKNKETSRILSETVLGPGLYQIPINPNGNALLSSLLVRVLSGGASVQVTYWQTTTQDETLERTPVGAHALVLASNMAAQQIVVSKIHSKLWAEVLVTGGSATVGIFGTIVDYTSSEITSTLQHSGSPVVNGGLGLPVLAQENGVMSFLRQPDRGVALEMFDPFDVNPSAAPARLSLGLLPVPDRRGIYVENKGPGRAFLTPDNSLTAKRFTIFKGQKMWIGCGLVQWFAVSDTLGNTLVVMEVV